MFQTVAVIYPQYVVAEFVNDSQWCPLLLCQSLGITVQGNTV